MRLVLSAVLIVWAMCFLGACGGSPGGGGDAAVDDGMAPADIVDVDRPTLADVASPDRVATADIVDGSTRGCTPDLTCPNPGFPFLRYPTACLSREVGVCIATDIKIR